MRTSMIILAVAALAVGCQRKVEVTTGTTPAMSTVPGPVGLATDNSSYAPGGIVRLRVTNSTDDTIGYNACTRTIERQAGGNSWTQHDEGSRMCTMVLALLPAKTERTETTQLPATMPAGTYRITLRFSPQKATPSGTTPGITASTAPFTVR